jgi:hypothetical protein
MKALVVNIFVNTRPLHYNDYTVVKQIKTEKLLLGITVRIHNTLFSLQLKNGPNELECFSSGRIFQPSVM